MISAHTFPHALLTANGHMIAALVLFVFLLIYIERRRREDLSVGGMPGPSASWSSIHPGMVWLRVVDRGPEVGRMGEQPLYAWLDVARDNSENAEVIRIPIRLGDDANKQPKGVFLRAGSVLYAQEVLPCVTRSASSTLSTTTATSGPSTGSRQDGFTLLDLLIAVVIIGILAAIALPNYTTYVTTSDMKVAQGSLLTSANTVRQFAQDNNTYLGLTCPVSNNPDFTLSCSNLGLSTYTLTATGTAGTRLAGFAFTLNQDGARSTTAPSGWASNSACWTTDRAGDCAQD